MNFLSLSFSLSYREYLCVSVGVSQLLGQNLCVRYIYLWVDVGGEGWGGG